MTIITSQSSPQLIRITSIKSHNGLQYQSQHQQQKHDFLCKTNINSAAGTTKTLKKSKSVQFATSTTKTSNSSCTSTSYKNENFSAMQSEYLESSSSPSCSSSSYYTLSDDTKNELWWTSKELKAISKQRQELVKNFVAKQHQLLLQQQENKQENKDQEVNNDTEDEDDVINQQFVSLYKNCASLNVTQVLRLKSTKELISRMSRQSASNSSEEDIAAADCLRGLEGKLSKSLSRQNKRHVSLMLSMMKENGQRQDEGKRVACMSLDNSVSTKLAKSSRASEIMARVLAQIDAKESSH